MSIWDIPFFNRPSYKIKRKGAGSLDETELLSIIFWKGRNEGTLELSNRILKIHNLNRLEYLGFNELLKLCKGDEIKVFKILALIELSKRYNKLKNNGFKNSISSAKDVYNMLVDEYGNKKKEYFICLYLDTKNKIIGEPRVISVGTLNSSLIHPREIFKIAIQESANSIILVHNHPSGDCSPSTADITITDRLKKAGELLDIKVLDHIIISDKKYWSWRENN